MVSETTRRPLYPIARRCRLTKAPTALNYSSGGLAIARRAIWNAKRLAMADVTVTERAAQRIGEILRREPPGAMLRLSVEGGGCSGFQYKFDIDKAQAEDDILVRRAEAAVLIDAVSLGYLAGSEIDFVDDLIGASFRVNNPQAKASCGCGTSFAL
jgi:iron-sulfur cluster assembly accessory protein